MQSPKNFLPARLSADIIAKRTKEGLSTIQAGVQAKVGFMVIHRAELGTSPTLDNYFLLCKWLGKDLSYYFKKQPAKK